MLYNLKRDPKKDPDGLTWEDIFPTGAEPEPQTEEEMLMTMNAWARRKAV